MIGFFPTEVVLQQTSMNKRTRREEALVCCRGGNSQGTVPGIVTLLGAKVGSEVGTKKGE